MDAGELLALQAPNKERFRSDGSAALITLKAQGLLSVAPNRDPPGASEIRD